MHFLLVTNENEPYFMSLVSNFNLKCFVFFQRIQISSTESRSVFGGRALPSRHENIKRDIFSVKPKI